MDTLETLSKELESWQNIKGLPNECALEQLNGPLATDEEKDWLRSFCERWDRAQGV